MFPGLKEDTIERSFADRVAKISLSSQRRECSIITALQDPVYRSNLLWLDQWSRRSLELKSCRLESCRSWC